MCSTIIKAQGAMYDGITKSYGDPRGGCPPQSGSHGLPSKEESHIKWDVDIQLYRKRQIAGMWAPGVPKSFIIPFRSLLKMYYREMYTQKLMISFGPKSVGMSELGQTIRIMQARLPWAEVIPVSFASFCLSCPSPWLPPTSGSLRLREPLGSLHLFSSTS